MEGAVVGANSGAAGGGSAGLEPGFRRNNFAMQRREYLRKAGENGQVAAAAPCPEPDPASGAQPGWSGATRSSHYARSMPVAVRRPQNIGRA